MDPDLAIDDELKPCQSDTGMRRREKANAWLGVPTFIMIFTGISGIAPRSVLSTVKSKIPS
jgi:hypothetical protein